MLRQCERLWQKTKMVLHWEMYIGQCIITNNVLKDANNLVEDSARDHKKAFWGPKLSSGTI